MESNSLTIGNTSFEKIEKQVFIGNKILEFANQSFVILTYNNYAFQVVTLNDYKKIIDNLFFYEKTNNTFFIDLINIQIITRNSVVVFFTQSGKYYSTSTNKLLKTKELKDIFDINVQDKLVGVLSIDNDLKSVENKYLVFSTRNGYVKKTKANLFLKELLKGVVAIQLYKKDILVNVRIAEDENQIVLGSKFGKLVRFDFDKVKPTLIKAYGKVGMNIFENEDNEIIGLSVINDFKSCILVITEKGLVKLSKIVDDDNEDVYRVTNRGGKGVKALNITQNSGFMSHIEIVKDNDVYLLITNLNNVLLLKTSNLRLVGRAEEPTNIVELNENEIISSIVKIPTLN